jgi:hypothetical protein
MQESAIIAGLIAKRAELDAALRRLEAQEAAIRAQRATIDAAIRVYDPTRKASRPKVPRGHGVVRLVLGTLRNARAPMTAREIAESVADARGVDAGDRKATDTLLHNVRNTLSRHNGKGLVREERDGVVLWRVG